MLTSSWKLASTGVWACCRKLGTFKREADNIWDWRVVLEPCRDDLRTPSLGFRMSCKFQLLKFLLLRCFRFTTAISTCGPWTLTSSSKTNVYGPVSFIALWAQKRDFLNDEPSFFGEESPSICSYTWNSGGTKDDVSFVVWRQFPGFFCVLKT